MNAKDFQIVKVIGRGAFGEVQLVSLRKSFCTLPLWTINNIFESESTY